MKHLKVLQVEHLNYSYHLGKEVLQDISFELYHGDALGITGLNGSGKTTLCHCLCGIIPHYLGGIMKGKVLINGKDTREMSLGVIAKNVGIVFQDPNLQIMMPTVEDELAFALENRGIPPATIKEKIYECMDFTGIMKLKDENPVHLSGGEKQLVAITAVLAMDPATIIFDESLSMLDIVSVNRIIDVMKKLREMRKTLIVVDHTEESLKIVDRIVVLNKGKVVK